MKRTHYIVESASKGIFIGWARGKPKFTKNNGRMSRVTAGHMLDQVRHHAPDAQLWRITRSKTKTTQ